MSKEKNISEIFKQKNEAIATIDKFLTELINSNSIKKADLISYWLKDYVKFLTNEQNFDPKNLKRYKRGDIVKVHFGFRIGSEEGGLHYAVVLDVNNALSSPTVTVVPLTSVKSNKDVNNLPKGNIYLGNELYNMLKNKFDTLYKTAKKELGTSMCELDNLTQYINSGNADEDLIKEKQNEILKRNEKINKTINILSKSKNEIDKMKIGSIALVNQIVTISKLRIYDPKTSYDVLSGIKLSNINLDKIDAEIMYSFTKQSTNLNKSVDI